MTAALWPHQKQGVEWLSERAFAMLYWEVGAGKTRVAIEAARAAEVALVLCPVPVGTAWVAEFERVDPSRVVFDLCGEVSAKKQKLLAAAEKAGGRIAIVINYESTWRKAITKKLASFPYQSITCDESHKIKSTSSKHSKWVAKLAEKHPTAKRICLTGTPLPNDPRDWWGQFRFLSPEVLGTNYSAYLDRICFRHPDYRSMITGWKQDGLDALAARISPHISHVKTDDVLDLPELINVDIPVKLSKEEMDFHKEMKKEMVATAGDGTLIVADNAMVRSTRLRQSTSGYVKTETGIIRFSERSSKGEALAEWLKNLPAEEPVVIFCSSHDEMDQCHRICQDKEVNRESRELSGRRRQHDAWAAGDGNVLVVQQQAGGAGVNLFRAAYGVYWSLSWSLGDLTQSLGRLRRPGQTRTTRFYHLVAKGTIDEDIYDAIDQKRDIVEAMTRALRA